MLKKTCCHSSVAALADLGSSTVRRSGERQNSAVAADCPCSSRPAPPPQQPSLRSRRERGLSPAAVPQASLGSTPCHHLQYLCASQEKPPSQRAHAPAKRLPQTAPLPPSSLSWQHLLFLKYRHSNLLGKKWEKNALRERTKKEKA